MNRREFLRLPIIAGIAAAIGMKPSDEPEITWEDYFKQAWSDHHGFDGMTRIGPALPKGYIVGNGVTAEEVAYLKKLMEECNFSPIVYTGPPPDIEYYEMNWDYPHHQDWSFEELVTTGFKDADSSS